MLMASNGIDALEVLSSGAHVDLVVIEYLMPGMDGDRVVQSLRATFLISTIERVPGTAFGRTPQWENGALR